MKRLLTPFFLVLIAASVIAGCGDKPEAAPEGGILFDDLWIRPADVSPDTTARVATALYGSVRNEGAETRLLIGGASSVAGAVEMHRTEIVDGVAKMRQAESLEIPAGGTLTLEPGGTHVMLINLMRDLRPGDEVPVVLRFENGEERLLQVTVREP